MKRNTDSVSQIYETESVFHFAYIMIFLWNGFCISQKHANRKTKSLTWKANLMMETTT